MKGMTDEKIEMFLKRVIQIIKDSETKEDAIKKIEALMK